jgi:hypothetical protein
MFQRTEFNTIAEDRIRKRASNVQTAQISGSVPSNQDSVDTLSSKEILNCDTIATTSITLSGEQTINNHTTAQSVVIVNAQGSSIDNGVYITSSSSWIRINRNLNDIAIYRINDGYFEGSYWETEVKGFEIGTDNINFIPFSASVNPYTEQANDTNLHLATDNGQFLVSAINSDNYDNIDYTFEGDIVQKDSNGDLQNYGTIRQLQFTVTSAELKLLNTTPLELIPPVANCLIEIISLPVFRYNYVANTYGATATTYLRMEESGRTDIFYQFPTDIGAQTSSFSDYVYDIRTTSTLTNLFSSPRLQIYSDTNWTGLGTSTLTIKFNYRYRYML